VALFPFLDNFRAPAIAKTTDSDKVNMDGRKPIAIIPVKRNESPPANSLRAI